MNIPYVCLFPDSEPMREYLRPDTEGYMDFIEVVDAI